MKILILRVSAIGDVVHTLPAIFLIKKQYPNAQINWVVQQKAANLLINQPFLNKVWILPNKFLFPQNWLKAFKIINQIRKTKWDAILDFQGIIKTSIILSFLSGEKYGFDSKNARLGLTSLFTKHHTKPNYQNIIQKNLSLASSMLLNTKKIKNLSCPTITELKKSFYLKIPYENKIQVNSWIFQNNLKKFIILAPNTTWPSKHWPQKNWESLFIKLIQNQKFDQNFKIVLVGANFGEQAKNLSKTIKNQKLDIKICPDWDLKSTCYLIQKSDLVLAPDTGLLHLADFLSKNNIGIFGPTNAKVHGPFLKTSNMNNAIQIQCPHHQQKYHGTKSKDKNSSEELNCMYKLTPEKLLNKIFRVLKI